MSHIEAGNIETIAVVGMSARYPGAKDVQTYWRNLAASKESISFFTDEELIKGGIDPQLVSNPNYVKARGIYEGTYNFDASFFGYNPREAELIDPQQRVLLESAWEALEHAGYDPDTFAGRIGLFGGEGPTRQLFELATNAAAKRTFSHLSMITSNDKDYLATRVGYKLNFRGPCITVQTACSTSLVAIIVACQNLQNFQCDMALAGGVSLILNDREGYMYDEGGIVSPDGHNRAFDANGQGTLFSQGAGVVVLKRLEDARADRDHIHAVIRGFGLNNDGSARIGFTAPGMEGQIGVSSDAIAMAGISPESIGFVECHGTATPMGDPIEIAALTKSFRRYTQKRNFCAVGSVKTNIGHTDTAAGVAGFTKAVLALENKTIPASLHFETPNPKIDFVNSPFYVNNQPVEWAAGDEPRRAGVNSFGVGGTNAHVILEEAPEPPVSGPSRPNHLLVWSAKSGASLARMTERLAAHLEANPDVHLADVAFTLQKGRRVFHHRQALVCRDREDAIQALSFGTTGRVLKAVQEKDGRPVCFLFPGQGSQYADMGKQLYETETAFRETVDNCAVLLATHLGCDIRELLFPSEEQKAAANEQLDQTAFTQPALFIIEYALAKLLISWGIQPAAMLGHSIGEYVAACLAGVFSLKDALLVVATRGRLMQSLPRGSMAGVLLSEAEASEILKDVATLPGNAGLSIAAINSPSTCVVSGPDAVVQAVQTALDLKAIPCRPLRTSHAFHSAMMDPILGEFRAVLETITLATPAIPYLSNLTGTWIAATETISPDYYVRHLRNAVRFADGVGELLQNPSYLLVEVGPGTTLSTLAAQHPARTPDSTIVSTLPHAKQENPDDTASLLNALGRLWLEGATIEWTRFYAEEDRCRLALPTYPFQHEEYRVPITKGADAFKDLSKKKSDVTDWFYYPSWKRSPMPPTGEAAEGSSWLLFLDDHNLGSEIADRLRIDGQEVFTVRAGNLFEQDSATSFTIDPGNPEHYRTLLKRLDSIDKAPGNVVHLWAITHEGLAAQLEVTLDRSFYGLMFLGQALGTQFSTSPISLHIVSNDLYDIFGEAIYGPDRAVLLGPSKTIPHEYANISTRNIDVHLPSNSAKCEALVEMLLTEFTAQATEEVIAYRGSHRWLQTFEPFKVPSPTEESGGLRENGIYLITGGMGGIGLTLAEYLGTTFGAKLALLGRSPFPTKSDWPKWTATHADDDAISLKIAKFQAMEAAGAEVHIFRADVTDLAAMHQVVEQVKQRFGTIHGVIHAAGVAGDGIIELKDRATAQEVLAPKIKGTLVLDEVLRDTKLDFLLLCSSIASIFGSIGQVDYTAANAFLDAFASARRDSAGNRAIAVNWDRWDEVGMAVDKMATASQGSAYRANKPRPTPIEHPLFTGYLSEGDTSIYSLHLSAETHWVVGQHLVQNTPTLVGTAHLELARAAFAHTTTGPVDIRDVVFMAPLVMKSEERREVRVSLRPAKSGFEFTVSSGSEASGWQPHTMGRIAAASGASKSAAHNRGVIERCSRASSLDFFRSKSSTNDAGVVFLQLGKRWDNMNAVSVGSGESTATLAGSDEFVATLHLAAEFHDDLKSWGLHPALMDKATAFAVNAVADGVAYLPFSYKKIRIERPMPATVQSYARLHATPDQSDDFITFDLLIVDEHGETVMEIESYDLRRVRGEAFENAAKASAAAAGIVETQKAVINDTLKRDRLGEHILTREGTEVFRRVVAMS